jgi:hypothetical protein
MVREAEWHFSRGCDLAKRYSTFSAVARLSRNEHGIPDRCRCHSSVLLCRFLISLATMEYRKRNYSRR